MWGSIISFWGLNRQFQSPTINLFFSAAIHHLQAYEIDANTLDLSVFQSKTTFFLDLPVVQADRKQIKRFYDESIRNFRRVLPKVKKVKLKAQTYFFSPKNSVSLRTIRGLPR